MNSITKIAIAILVSACCVSLLSGQNSRLMTKNEALAPPALETNSTVPTSAPVVATEAATTYSPQPADDAASPLSAADGDSAGVWPSRSRSAAVPKVTTTLEVKDSDSLELQVMQSTAVISQKEMQSAAGTFGDFTRYLQVMPGVVWNS